MWLLILAGLLATSVGKETSSGAKPSSADDVVLLEIDVKEPSKRSPVSASAVYGGSPSQYIIRHGDDAQELAPEYLSFVEQYTHAQAQAYSPTQAPQRTGPPPRRPLPAYARQQQQLQQTYQNQRVPAVAPPRPRLTLHAQAQAQADAQADYQARLDAQNRAETRLSAAGTNAPQYQLGTAYPDPKLGTFEQELLQLVSANQAQEFKLSGGKVAPKQQAYPQYTQEVLAYQNQYVKPTVEPVQEEQYHVETSGPRYQQQHVPEAYTPPHQAQLQYHSAQYPSKPAKTFRPSAQYYDEPAQHQVNSQGYTSHNVAEAQANAQAQALAFQKISQASHVNHQQAALEQIRLVAERHQQQSALEQISQGEGVSEAGKAQITEEIKDPEAAYRAKLKAQSRAHEAESRRAQEAAEYKAHADAILALQAQQQAHLKAQEDAHTYALNFEKNQIRAQAQAQALANAQALALWKSHQAARANAQKEAQAAARAQVDARRRDPENTPVIQYLLPNNAPLPAPNSYFTSSDVQKYQTSGSSYVPRSTPRPSEGSEEAQNYQAVNQPRQAHKHKIPHGAQSSTYVSQSGLLKKAPIKSLTIEEIIEQDQAHAPQILRIPTSKTQAPLTQADLEALINAGYTVTPVPDPRPTQQSYALENTSSGYYVKKHSTATPRPEYAYPEVTPRSRRPVRKQRPILQQPVEAEAEGNEKVTYLIPLEPSAYGTRRSSQSRTLVAEE